MEDVAVQQAWTELTEITTERERYAEMRADTEKELDVCRERSAILEDVSICKLCRNRDQITNLKFESSDILN